MSLDRETLLGVAHAERQRLGRMIQYAEPGSWEEPSAAAGWWNRDVMAHLAAHDTIAAQLVAGEPPTEMNEFKAQLGDRPFAVDDFNAWSVNRRSGLTSREVLTLWGRSAESFLVHASLLTPRDWEERGFPWLSGDIGAAYLVQSRVVEWWLHGEDCRATNGLGPAIQHWPVHLTLDLGVRMLPWALGQAGEPLPGLSVQIDAEGAGEGSWHWGLAAGEVPPPRKKPDAYIQGRAPQLALVAGRRLSLEAVLASGTVVLGGNTDLAELVLRRIRAYV